MKSYLYFLFIIFCFITFTFAKDNALSKKIIGYYINWGMYGAHNGYMPENIPWDKITHINYAFAEIIPNTWGIKGTDDWADIQCGPQQNGQIGIINSMKEKYGVKTLISVGGWTRSGYFSPMASTEAGRSAFADSCVSYIRKYKFDGVDIDWEYPCFVRQPDYNLAGDQACNGKPEDKTNYTLLLQKLRQKLDAAGIADGRKYYLSVAAPGGYDKIEGPQTFQEPEKYGQYIDWMNVMTYDYHGGWDTITGHLAPIYPNPNSPFPTSPVDIKNKYNADAIIKYYISKGIPPEKINIGAAYYGRSWKNVENGGTYGLFQRATPRDFYETNWNYGVEPFYTLKEWESNSAYYKGYDTISKAAFLYNASSKLFYTYDNERSVADKCDYMFSNNLGGIFFWEFTGDYPIKGSTLTNLIYNKISSTNVLNSQKSKLSNLQSLNISIFYFKGKIFFNNTTGQNVKLTLYNAIGKRLYSFIIDNGVNYINVNVLPGIYLCSINNCEVIKLTIGN